MSGQVWLGSPYRSLLWGPNILIQAYIVFNQPKHKNRQFSTVFFWLSCWKAHLKFKIFCFVSVFEIRSHIPKMSSNLLCDWGWSYSLVFLPPFSKFWDYVHIPPYIQFVWHIPLHTQFMWHIPPHTHFMWHIPPHTHIQFMWHIYTVHMTHTTTYTVHVALWFCSM